MLSLEVEHTPASQPKSAAMATVLIPAAVQAVAGAIEAGIEILNLVESDDRVIAVGISVSNATKHALTTEGYYTAWGHMKKPPSSIAPGTTQSMVARKSEITWTGSCGVAVWKIGDTEKRLVVLWSDPWWTRNTLAVGIKEGKVMPENIDKIYSEMYYNEETWFSRQGYVKSEYSPPVEKIDNSKQFKVQGTMGTENKCMATVHFLPLLEGVVADTLKHVIAKYQKTACE